MGRCSADGATSYPGTRVDIARPIEVDGHLCSPFQRLMQVHRWHFSAGLTSHSHTIPKLILGHMPEQVLAKPEG
jgi:hypothetical protein